MGADGASVAPEMLDGEAVAAGVCKAENAILALFQETGLNDPQGVTHLENGLRSHGFLAFHGADPKMDANAARKAGLLIALRADMFDVEEVREVVDIVPGKAMALDVVTSSGALTFINVHGPCSGDQAPIGAGPAVPLQAAGNGGGPYARPRRPAGPGAEGPGALGAPCAAGGAGVQGGGPAATAPPPR